VTAQDDGFVKLFTIDLKTQHVQEKSSTGAVTAWHVCPTNKYILGLYDSMLRPAEIVAISLDDWKFEYMTALNDLSSKELSVPEVLSVITLGFLL
jgi:hypothetical protein